jgi:hypothetical protein
MERNLARGMVNIRDALDGIEGKIIEIAGPRHTIVRLCMVFHADPILYACRWRRWRIQWRGFLAAGAIGSGARHLFGRLRQLVQMD